jgi:hypothetical protein
MKHIFLGSNTPQGYFGFYEEQLKPLEKVYILKGGPGTGKSTLLKRLAKRGETEGHEVEVWHCSGDPQSLDGVYFVDKKTAVADGTSPHALEAKLPGLRDNIVALGDHINRAVLSPHGEEIKSLLNDKKNHLNSANCQINSAFCNLRAIYFPYREAINTAKLIQLASSVAGHIRQPVDIRRQFSSSLTPDGFITYKDHLADKQIIALKASSPTVVKKFLEILQQMLAGYSSYHCPFEPLLAESLVVGRYAVVPFSECVFASDVIELDTALKAEIDEEEFVEEKKLYERAVALAVRHLSDARECHMEIEKFYIAAMDFSNIDKITERLENEILG